MNCAHNGSRLGHALYQVCNWLQIVHKVSVSAQFTAVQCLLNLFMLFNIGWSCYLWQHQEQRHNDARVCTLLSHQDRRRFQCQAPSNQVRVSFYPCNCIDVLVPLIGLGALLTSSTLQLKLSSPHAASPGTTMATLMTTTSQMMLQCQCKMRSGSYRPFAVDKCWAHLVALWTLGTWTLRLDYGLVD